MEKEICRPLTIFRIDKNMQLMINKEHRHDLDEILEESHKIVHEAQDEYSKIYDNLGVSPDCHFAHNEYILELTGVNSLYSKYQLNILPQLLQVKSFFSSH
jgi:hypothetical protein